MNEKEINKLSRQTNKEKTMLLSRKELKNYPGDNFELTPVNPIKIADVAIYRIFVMSHYDITIVQCFVKSIKHIDKIREMQNSWFLDKVVFLLR